MKTGVVFVFVGALLLFSACSAEITKNPTGKSPVGSFFNKTPRCRYPNFDTRKRPGGSPMPTSQSSTVAESEPLTVEA